MLQTAVELGGKTYIVIDGLDECGREESRAIVEIFQGLVSNGSKNGVATVRCFFVSQDDSTCDMPTIVVTSARNQDDLENFVRARHEQLESRFGELRSKDNHISNLLLARSQGNSTARPSAN